MLISKKSPRKSEQFGSRFRDGSAADFPLRQYMRCREDFTSGLVHVVLYVAFAVTLVMFTISLGDLFEAHGENLNPWISRATVVLMGFFILSVLRRLYYKVVELREIRRDMDGLRESFRNTPD